MIRCGDGGASSAGQPRRGGSSEGCRGVDCRLLCRLLPVRGGGACLKQSKALKYSIVANVCAALGARIPSLRWSALRFGAGAASHQTWARVKPGLSARLGKMSEDPSCAFWIGAPWLASVLQAASITLQACLRDVCSTQRCDLRLENHRVTQHCKRIANVRRCSSPTSTALPGDKVAKMHTKCCCAPPFAASHACAAGRGRRGPVAPAR